MFRSITCKITLCLARLWISILYHLSDRVIGHLIGAVFRIYIWSLLLLFGLAALSIHQEPDQCSNYQESKGASNGSNDGSSVGWTIAWNNNCKVEVVTIVVIYHLCTGECCKTPPPLKLDRQLLPSLPLEQLLFLSSWFHLRRLRCTWSMRTNLQLCNQLKKKQEIIS